MNVLKKIWDKVKEYKAGIIIYFIMLAVSIGTDMFMGGFNPPKYTAYAVLFIVLIAVMIFYKQKIKNALDQAIENHKLYFLKKYKITVIIYLMMLSVSIVSDIFFAHLCPFGSGFSIIKYIIYALVLIIIIALLKKYKEKIKEIIKDIETDIDNKINKE